MAGGERTGWLALDEKESRIVNLDHAETIDLDEKAGGSRSRADLQGRLSLRLFKASPCRSAGHACA